MSNEPTSTMNSYHAWQEWNAFDACTPSIRFMLNHESVTLQISAGVFKVMNREGWDWRMLEVKWREKMAAAAVLIDRRIVEADVAANKRGAMAFRRYVRSLTDFERRIAGYGARSAQDVSSPR